SGEVNDAVEHFAHRTGGGHAAADFMENAERRFLFFLLQQGRGTFGGFLDEEAHARMGSFHIRLKTQRADAFRGGRSDGSDNHALEPVADGVFHLELASYLKQVRDLNGGCKNNDVEFAGSDRSGRLL